MQRRKQWDVNVAAFSRASKRAAAIEAVLLAELRSIDEDELDEANGVHLAMLGFREMYLEERGWS